MEIIKPTGDKAEQPASSSLVTTSTGHSATLNALSYVQTKVVP
jgi:hypothetical protein